MARALIDFQDIYTQVVDNIGEDTANASRLDQIKTNINQIYINEICGSGDRQWWLEKETTITHAKPFIDGTVDVTPDSTTITFSQAPGVALGSFDNYKFATTSFDEVYTITSHTAGATTATINIAYKGSNNDAASFYVWRDRFDLPTDARETVDVRHNRWTRPMKGKSRRDYDSDLYSAPKAVGYPSIYRTVDYFDPNGGTEEESSRYRQTLIHPSIMPNQESISLQVTYIQDVTALDLDADEPLMPIEYRDIIVLGATALSYMNIVRDDETAMIYQQKFERRLAKMIGKHSDSNTNMPIFGVQGKYIRAKKRYRGGSHRMYADFFPQGNSTGHPAITFLEGTTLLNAILNGTISGSAVLDDDTFATASSTTLATSESIKAYVDAHLAPYSSVTIDFSDYSAAATTETIDTGFTIPENQVLSEVLVKTTTAWAGTSITAVEFDVGFTGSDDEFVVAYDGLAAVGNTNFQSNAPVYAAFGGAVTVRVKITTTGANVSALTAGSLDIYYKLSTLG